MIKNVKTRMIIAGAALFCAGVALGQNPVVNIGTKHGNLRAAQEYIVNAYGKIDEAQKETAISSAATPKKPSSTCPRPTPNSAKRPATPNLTATKPHAPVWRA